MTRRASDRLLSIILFGISGVFFFERKLRYPSNVLPYIVIAILLICGLIILIRSFMGKAVNELDSEKSKEEQRKSSIDKSIVGLSIGSLIYIVTMNLIGFFTTSFIYMSLIAYLLQPVESKSKKKRILGSLIMSFITLIFVYLLFKAFLKVPTPRGLIF